MSELPEVGDMFSCGTCSKMPCVCLSKPTPPPDAQAMPRHNYRECYQCTASRPRFCEVYYEQENASLIEQVKSALLDQSTPGGVKATYQQLLDVNTAQRETIRQLEASEQLFRNEMDRMLDKLASILGKPRNEVGYENGLDQLQARLTASEAKHKWTTARPTVAGWYWWRKLPDHKEEIVRLFLRNGFLCVDWGAKDADYLSPWAKDVGGEFQGPLTPGGVGVPIGMVPDAD